MNESIYSSMGDLVMVNVHSSPVCETGSMCVSLLMWNMSDIVIGFVNTMWVCMLNTCHVCLFISLIINLCIKLL